MWDVLEMDIESWFGSELQILTEIRPNVDLQFVQEIHRFRCLLFQSVNVQDIPRATRVFLVLIMTSRSLFRPIFTSGVPCDNSEMNVHDRS